ncbi:hypothetical protein DFH08DRAFT_1023867 [Mycena albidolilacea]|uniref:Uncharacterized protein n=1 Tax=Mycena albidolilacea TaxID=1033008 RepID=A0AAD7EII7_9AGAR|nr:hypothetical protein DFH08DRAFT_1023867 [Mycena albidolilacea]
MTQFGSPKLPLAPEVCAASAECTGQSPPRTLYRVYVLGTMAKVEVVEASMCFFRGEEMEEETTVAAAEEETAVLEEVEVLRLVGCVPVFGEVDQPGGQCNEFQGSRLQKRPCNSSVEQRNEFPGLNKATSSRLPFITAHAAQSGQSLAVAAFVFHRCLLSCQDSSLEPNHIFDGPIMKETNRECEVPCVDISKRNTIAEEDDLHTALIERPAHCRQKQKRAVLEVKMISQSSMGNVPQKMAKSSFNKPASAHIAEHVAALAYIRRRPVQPAFNSTQMYPTHAPMHVYMYDSRFCIFIINN